DLGAARENGPGHPPGPCRTTPWHVPKNGGRYPSPYWPRPVPCSRPSHGTTARYLDPWRVFGSGRTAGGYHHRPVGPWAPNRSGWYTAHRRVPPYRVRPTTFDGDRPLCAKTRPQRCGVVP